MRLTAFSLLLVVASAKCGKEWWTIKTGTDSDANNVNMSPETTTISALIHLPKPSSLPKTSRIKPTELQTFTIEATLVGYKKEGDEDYHLVIEDKAGNTMIVEIPDPECVADGKGPFYTGIKKARAQFEAVFHAQGSLKKTNTVVTVTGVAFFDKLHGQTGVAPNGIELHPVLDIDIGHLNNNLSEIRAWDEAQDTEDDVSV